MARAPSRLIHLSEFIDALAALRQGSVVVVMDPENHVCVLDGMQLLCSFHVLHDYGLVAEFENTDGFEGLRYFRISDAGLDFADRALSAWHSRAWHERLALRLFS